MLTSNVREIRFYRNANGDSPVEEFLDGLGPKQAQKVAWAAMRSACWASGTRAT
jgi:hypothetical protein